MRIHDGAGDFPEWLAVRREVPRRTWLPRLVINECLGRRRRRDRRQSVIPMIPYPVDDALDRIASVNSRSPDALTERAPMRKFLESTIDALPESLRAAFALISLEELTVADTAHCLGIPAETVRSRHLRAKSRLREALEHSASLAERDVFEFAGERCDRIVARVSARLTVALKLLGRRGVKLRERLQPVVAGQRCAYRDGAGRRDDMHRCRCSEGAGCRLCPPLKPGTETEMPHWETESFAARREIGVTDCCCSPRPPHPRRAGARMQAISGGDCLIRHSEK